MDFESFLRFHKTQLESSQIPSVFWHTIFTKVTKEIFNTGDYFSIEKVEFEDDECKEEESVSNGNTLSNHGTWQKNEKYYEKCEYRVVVECDRMEPDNRDNIFLIDHMFTFELAKRTQLLNQNPALVDRLCGLMDIKGSETLTSEQKVQLIEHGIFKYCQSYCLHDSQQANLVTTYWYLMDEFGSRIGHSIEPSFRSVPFSYLPGGIAYNLLFPIKSLLRGDLVTRNYLDSTASSQSDPNLIAALMLPWESCDLSNVSYLQTESESAFSFKHKPEEIMPESPSRSLMRLPFNDRLKVFSQYKYVNENLKDERFILVEDPEKANILWLYEPFYDYKDLVHKQPNTLVNQFPFETVLCTKDLFAIVCRRAGGESSSHLNDLSPLWLMPTFDLQSELVQFVSYFQNREAQGLDNHWIVKPWNLSRGLETIITSNVAEIVKLRNALPKVVCKYIERPVLFRRDDISASVKFDLRFIVLLKRVDPLELYIYKNFWIRFANLEYSLDELDNYEKHFTVMNYATDDTVQLRQMFCSEFIGKFDSQYGKNAALQLQRDTYAAIKEAFRCATMKAPPAGIGHCGQSRALYGIDVLPRWHKDPCSGEDRIQPTLLEVNWMPDCKRACEYYPTFFEEVFNALFVDIVSDNIVQL